MNYLRKVDFAQLAAAKDRMSQPLLDHDSGATSCSVNCIKTPPGEGSPAGMHTHKVDQLLAFNTPLPEPGVPFARPVE
ncbi:MAG: hypothetical protein NVS9B11_05360 [Candidatus Dormibacteraceae bacterium]